MIRYGERSKGAVAVLFSAYNPFDLYVEDESLLNLYRTLVVKASGGSLKDFRPIALGSRKSVLAKAVELRADRSRKRLFVIDGDFDAILGKGAPGVRDVHRLDCYSIENKLIDVDALSEIVMIYTPNISKAAAMNMIQEKILPSAIVGYLFYIFVVYSYMHTKNLPGTTAKTALLSFLRFDSGGNIEYQSLRSYARQLRRNAVVGSSLSGLKLHWIDRKGAIAPSRRIEMVSGKTFLLPLVHRQMRTHASFAGSMRDLLMLLAGFSGAKLVRLQELIRLRLN